MQLHQRFAIGGAGGADGNDGVRRDFTAATPSRTSAPKNPSISSASDASKAGPAVRSQLFSARLVHRSACCGPAANPAAIAIALDVAEKKGRRYDGVVALGCVIRGDTIHFEIVSQESARGLLNLSVARSMPIGNGIITVNTLSQAFARARVEEQDKGGDAARAALALIGLKQQLEKA